MTDEPTEELTRREKTEEPATSKPPEVKAPEGPIGQGEQKIIERIDKDGDPNAVLQDITESGKYIDYSGESPSAGINNLESDNLEPAPLGFGKKDRSRWEQMARGKQNIEYELPEGDKLFAKYTGGDIIEGLKHEKEILDKLAPTGVVPIAGELKIYPNGNKARLLMERVAGGSLDSKALKEEDGYGKQHPREVILSTAQAHNSVLKEGIVIVDVNKGTYILQQSPNGLSTKLVDFELSCDLNNPASHKRQKALLDWYRAKDFGLRMSGVKKMTTENAKRSDIHLWAKTMAEWMLGPNYSWQNVTISPEEQSQYQVAVEQVKPVVDAETIKQAKEDYQKMIADGSHWKGGEQAYIEYEIENTSPYKLRGELGSLTFKEMIKAKGIELPQAMVDFISKALSYDIRERPTSFDDLILSCSS